MAAISPRLSCVPMSVLTLLVVFASACAVAPGGVPATLSVAKLSVTVIQRHATNTNVSLQEINAYGGPCQVIEGESSDFVGGGFAIDTPSLMVRAMYEQNVNEWYIDAVTAGLVTTAGAHLTSFVTCLKPVVPFGYTVGTSGGTIPSGTTASFKALCAVGTAAFGEAVGGEYIIQHGAGYIETFQRSSDHGWIVSARATSLAPMDLEVHVFCERHRLTAFATQPRVLHNCRNGVG